MFVVSDLHMGDRSPKDNLCRDDREAMFDQFLAYVTDQKGQLVILGDFFELLRYPLDRILARRRALLDRLAKMDTIYVPGNHDEDLLALVGDTNLPHPFFERMSGAFVRQMGDKRFKFMHGHEVDPLVTSQTQSIIRTIGTVACFLEFRYGSCILSNDTVSDAFLEIGEHALELWARLTRRMNRAFRECCNCMPGEPMTLLRRQVRTRRMLGRFHQDRRDGLYDVAVVGHTHKAGHFDDWYLNSGSWTGPNRNFLRISPDSSATVCDWTRHGPRINHTRIAV